MVYYISLFPIVQLFMNATNLDKIIQNFKMCMNINYLLFVFNHPLYNNFKYLNLDNFYFILIESYKIDLIKLLKHKIKKNT